MPYSNLRNVVLQSHYYNLVQGFPDNRSKYMSNHNHLTSFIHSLQRAQSHGHLIRRIRQQRQQRSLNFLQYRRHRLVVRCDRIASRGKNCVSSLNYQ